VPTVAAAPRARRRARRCPRENAEKSAAAYEAALGREPSEAFGLLAVAPWLKAWNAGQNYFNECLDKYLEADAPPSD